jgi:hypothetical protein
VLETSNNSEQCEQQLAYIVPDCTALGAKRCKSRPTSKHVQLKHALQRLVRAAPISNLLKWQANLGSACTASELTMGCGKRLFRLLAVLFKQVRWAACCFRLSGLTYELLTPYVLISVVNVQALQYRIRKLLYILYPG